MDRWDNTIRISREDIYDNLRRLGYSPTGRSYASSQGELKKQSAQWRIRDNTERPVSYDEVEWALMEALVLEGGIPAWRGDGLGCAAQMVWAQHERATKAEVEAKRLRTALENIALMDEADGHELRADHAMRAVGIASSTLGKHPSEIAAERFSERLASQRKE